MTVSSGFTLNAAKWMKGATVTIGNVSIPSFQVLELEEDLLESIMTWMIFKCRDADIYPFS